MTTLTVVFAPPTPIALGAVTLTNPAGKLILRAPANNTGHANGVLYDLGYRLTGDWQYAYRPNGGSVWTNTALARP
jgi:hypothetical protein